jgi:hypothetical protein
MAVGLRAEDELLHVGGGDPDLHDCLEFNLYDIHGRLGAFFSLTGWPGRGYTTMTACLYLPDGRAAFLSERSGMGALARFDAGGLRVEVIRPFHEVQVSFDGKLLLLEDPAAMLHPDRPPTEHPRVDAEVQLTYSATSTLYEQTDGVPAGERPDPAAGGHYEQLVSAFGSVRVGDDRWAVDGLGLRGHCWGQELATPALYQRRFTANIGPSWGFMACHVVGPDGGERRAGFVWDGTALHLCSGLTLKTSWTGGDRLHRGVDLTLKAHDQTWHAAGKVLSLLAPTDGGAGEEPVTRLCEGLTEWRLDDGQVGYGVSEYIDRMVDGEPAGLAQ